MKCSTRNCFFNANGKTCQLMRTPEVNVETGECADMLDKKEADKRVDRVLSTLVKRGEVSR